MRFFILALLVLGLLASPVFAEANDTNTTDVVQVTVTTNDTPTITENDTPTITENDTPTTTENVAQVNETESNETGDLEAAAADLDIDESQVGSLPGDFTYGFKRFFENVDKFFTFDKATKAKKQARYGKLRSIEAHLLTKKAQQYMADNNIEGANNTLELANQILADYEQETGEAQELIEEAVDEGSADEADVQEVQTELRNSIVVLQRVYEKVPESAKAGVARALNNSINNQERHEEKMQEKLEKKQAKKSPPTVTQSASDENEEDENETESAENGKNKTKGKPETAGKSSGKEKNQTGSDDDDDDEDDDEDETETEDEGADDSDHGNGKGNGKDS